MENPSFQNPLGDESPNTFNKRILLDKDAASSSQKRKPPNRSSAPVPEYLIIHAISEGVKLSSLSPFLINKTLVSAAGAPKAVQKLRSGDLLIQTACAKHSELLLKITQLGDTAVSVIPHQFLNTSRGVIAEPDLMGCSDEELLTELGDQGVVAARRIMSRREGIFVPTRNIILTFNTPTLPSEIKAGYLNCRVRPYIPNPVRCFKCQLFGHSQQSCRGSTTCGRCGSKEHATDTCNAPPCCVNCKGDHPAYARSCPKWAEEKEIQRLKTIERISYPEARRKIASTINKTSYASIVKATVTRSVQTEISIPSDTKLSGMSKFMHRDQVTSNTGTQASTSGIQKPPKPAYRSTLQQSEVVFGNMSGPLSRKKTSVAFKLTPLGKLKQKKKQQTMKATPPPGKVGNSDGDTIEIHSRDECL